MRDNIIYKETKQVVPVKESVSGFTFVSGSNTCRMNQPVVVLVVADLGWFACCYQSLAILLLRSEQDRCSGGCDHLIRTLTMNLALHWQRC